MLFKFQKIVGCIEPWVKNRDTNRIVSLCIVTALIFTDTYLEEYGKYLFCPEGTKKMRENKGQGGPGQVPAPGQGKDSNSLSP